MRGEVVDIGSRRPRFAPETGWVHVTRMPDASLEVQHESRSGDSWGLIAGFAPDELEQAVAAALNALPDYRPARLGLVALPLELDSARPAA